MSQVIELEMRIEILERMIETLLKNNHILNSPEPSDIGRIKMEVFQEMKNKYPNEKIEYPKL